MSCIMLWFLAVVGAIRFFRWQATPQQSISLIPPTAETVYISVGPSATSTSQATGCPLQAYVSRNMSHAFWPAINGTDHCDIQSFCQNRTASLYCFRSTRFNATDSSCWPVMVVACPSGLVLTCAEGFVCDDGSLPWWRDQSRRNPMALPVCRSIWESDGLYDGSLLRNQTCSVKSFNVSVTDALGPSGVLAPSWATCIVTPTIISTCQALPVPTRLSACNLTTSSSTGVGGATGCITTICSQTSQTSAIYYGSETSSACYYGPSSSAYSPSCYCSSASAYYSASPSSYYSPSSSSAYASPSYYGSSSEAVSSFYSSAYASPTYYGPSSETVYSYASPSYYGPSSEASSTVAYMYA